MGIISAKIPGADKYLNDRLRKIERAIEALQKNGVSVTTSKKSPGQGGNVFKKPFGQGGNVGTITGRGDGFEQVQDTPQVVMSDSGEMELYNPITGDRLDVVLPATAKVYGTKAGQAIPSSYYLDLRITTSTNTTRNIKADYLTLHDNSSPQKTVAVSNVDVTSDVTVAGPIANGRDQSGAFGTGKWIYFFVIYNSTTGSVASLSSLSQTSPTLPPGYDFSVYLGACWIDSSAHLVNVVQLNDIAFHNIYGFIDAAPSVADTYQAFSQTFVVPDSAKSIIGYFGLSTSAASSKGMGVASDINGTCEIEAVVPPSTDIAGYELKSPVYFHIPLLEAHTIYWKGSNTNSIYGVIFSGWVDDI